MEGVAGGEGRGRGRRRGFKKRFGVCVLTNGGEEAVNGMKGQRNEDVTVRGGIEQERKKA